MEEFVREHPCNGYRKIRDLLYREGFPVKLKRIYHFWKCEGYRVAHLKHKKQRLGSTRTVAATACALDTGTTSGRSTPVSAHTRWAAPNWFSVVDEYAQERLTPLSECSSILQNVVLELVQPLRMRGVPLHTREDNGPGFQCHGHNGAGRRGRGRYLLMGECWKERYGEEGKINGARFNWERVDGNWESDSWTTVVYQP